MKKSPTYIDLFSGAGGFSLGFDQEGFENIFSVDIQSNSCKTYRHNFPNHHLLEKDVTSLAEPEIEKLLGGKKVDVLIGGPPCQGFSIAGNIGRKFIDDPRNHLFREFARVIKVAKPSYFVMENVARLYTHRKGLTREEMLGTFLEMGYQVECKVLNAADYGVPQIRKRLIFIGSKKNQRIIFPEREISKYVTVKEALNIYPDLKSGEESIIPNHVAMAHSEQMLRKMSYVVDGGDRTHIPLHLRPVSGDVRKYIRYKSDSPAVTVTGDMRKIFHYAQNRALTVRELARLQSFPDDFIFMGRSISQQQQVGNSVPPKMAKAIAKVIKRMKDEA